MSNRKYCVRCKEYLPLDRFQRKTRAPDGRTNVCKKCRSEELKRAYRKNLFTFLTRLKRSYCNSRGIPFNLDKGYLQQCWTGVCPICNKVLTVDSKASDTQYCIDRFVPSKGYTKGNVTFLCSRCNRIKYDATIDELQKIVNWMRSVESSTTISKESTLQADGSGSAQPRPNLVSDDIVCSLQECRAT